MKQFTYSLNGQLLGYGKRLLKHLFWYKSLEEGHFSYMKICNFIKISWHKMDNFIEYEFKIFLGQNYIFEINGDGFFNPKEFLSFEIKARRTRVKFGFKFLGFHNLIRFGHIVTDAYDSHLDKYYYWEYDEENDISYEYTDENKQTKYEFIRPHDWIYKDFYISKFLKIYTKDWLNCLYGRAAELALPFFHYLKIDFKKPFHNREWIGFRGIINFEQGFLLKITLMLFKHELRFIIAKNKLYRQSNLFSILSIKRILKLYKHVNYIPKECCDYINTLLDHKKSLQFIYMFNNSSFMAQDLKKYLTEVDFEHICPKHRFCKPIFDLICSKIIELDIPIDTWECLTQDNTYIDEYAKKKLLQIRNEYIALKQKSYTFVSRKDTFPWDNPERLDYSNGFHIIDYIETGKNNKTYLKTCLIDKNNNFLQVPENIWVRYITKNNKAIGYYQGEIDEEVVFDIHHHNNLKLFGLHNLERIDYGTIGSFEKYLKGYKGNKCGLCNDEGNILIQPNYRNLSEAGNGFIIAQTLKNKYGIIDVNENIIIPFDYEDIHTLNNRYFTAKKKGKWGLYDYSNKNIIPLQYQDFYFYNDYGVAKYKSKWGIIDINNSCVTGYIFDEIDINADNIPWLPVGSNINNTINMDNIILDVNVCINKKWGTYSLIDGKQILPLEYDKIGYFYEGICLVEYKSNHQCQEYVNRNNEYIAGGVIDQGYKAGTHPVEGMWKMKIVDEICFYPTHDMHFYHKRRFEKAHNYSEGLVAVSLHGHWGFMDKQQNIIIPIIFDKVSDFHDGKALVTIDRKSSFIDKTGTQINIRGI